MDTKIEWCDKVWNPIRGCSLVSAGCENCYAMKQAHRFSGNGQPYEGLTALGPHGPRWTGKIKLVQELLAQPFRWKKPCRIFVNSMSDLFHEDVPFEFIDAVFAVMSLSPQHIFQILTKRPSRMLEYMTFNKKIGRQGFVWHQALKLPGVKIPPGKMPPYFPYPHVWLGVSVEDQKTADERIPLLLQTPAAVRWISYEPALGQVTLNPWLLSEHGRRQIAAMPGLSWVVVGGESGPHARPMHPGWARSVRDQCVSAGVPFFFKQWGEWAPVQQTTDYPGCPRMVSEGDANVSLNGEVHIFGGNIAVPNEGTGHPMRKIGKKRAGRLLDGKEWSEFPVTP